jgi:UDP-N-acetyl-2-amino-2-deoxyglucuronate dehydrogenase
MIHIGLIGAGNISDTHARAAAAIPGVEIAAVCAPTRAHAEALAARHGATAYDALGPFLDHEPLDVAIIGSPSGLHAQQGIAAAKRGIHVLVEKPLDVTTERADALIAAAAEAGVTLGVIFQDRLKPDVVRLQSLLDGGRLGTPILAEASVKWYRPPEYYAGSRWRGTRELDGGGALMNQGIHTVDLLLKLFGPVRRVSARTATLLHSIEVEDTAVATLEFANGAVGTLEATTAAYPGYSRRIVLTGSNGTVQLDGDRLITAGLRGTSGDEDAPPPAAAAVSASSPVVADATAHQRIVEDFIRAVEKRTPPVCDGKEGRQSVALIEAIYQSSRMAEAVTL